MPTPTPPHGPTDRPTDRPTEQLPTHDTQQLPPAAATGAAAPAEPPPRKPGVWREATSTTGGRIAVAVAAGLAALLVLGSLGIGSLVVARAAFGHGGAERMTAGHEDGRKWSGPRGDEPGGPPQPQGPGQGRGNGKGNGGEPGGGGRKGGIPGLGAVEHGEFTTQGGDGKPATMLVQRGEVTKASATSVTVRSSDDFTATYAVDGSTRVPGQAPAVGDRVIVLATKDGSKAVSIRPVR
ncbi:hypothetical protein [Knoellia koreensis]|uniref:DUF5666 domain-containing protein n=1 Tax=Knoellia koreensis TaxID=2730921 RepID=A0A849HQF5_9MICO|nr:hypothetical protein [Knoellia sp. DB2414S]NNM46817.1 hypothetical protein [Knoellia sp. DB2414S]